MEGGVSGWWEVCGDVLVEGLVSKKEARFVFGARFF